MMEVGAHLLTIRPVFQSPSYLPHWPPPHRECEKAGLGTRLQSLLEIICAPLITYKDYCVPVTVV